MTEPKKDASGRPIDGVIDTSMRAPYEAVYRVNAPDQSQDAQLPGALLKKGPFELDRSVPIVQFGDGSAWAAMGRERIAFGSGMYLVISHEFDIAQVGEAALVIAERAGLIEISFPHLLAEKVFEGFVNTPGSIVFVPAGPMTLSARPFEGVLSISSGLHQAVQSLEALEPQQRERFRLASRWFRRGCETLDLVDRFLYWYIVLEVYPAAGDADVPKHVRDLVHAKLYPSLDAGRVKELIGIGPIASIRGRIAHDGLSCVPADERAVFEERLAQLEALTRTCLRLLSGVAPGNDLDRWVIGSG